MIDSIYLNKCRESGNYLGLIVENPAEAESIKDYLAAQGDSEQAEIIQRQLTFFYNRQHTRIED